MTTVTAPRPLQQCAELARKDLRTEWRAGEALLVTAPFGAVALLLVPLAVGSDTPLLRELGPGVYWLVVLLFWHWPPVQRLAIRYARQVDFLTERLRPGAALGLLLTAQLVVLVALGAAFGAVLDDVARREELISMDAPVSRFVLAAREPWLTRVAETVTWAGSTAVLVPLLLLAGLSLRHVTRSWRPLIVLTITLGGASALSVLIKLLIARPRPIGMALIHETGYAFPSGHTTTTAATAGWLGVALVLGTRTSRWGRKVALVTTALVIAGLVGLSRVYLGVHEPTDVLGGWSLGGLWVAAVTTLDVSGSRRYGVWPRPVAAAR